MELREKQQKILDAAIELFKEKGFVGASMRDLAAKLDIKAASLYAHIRSKDELLEWIAFSTAEKFFEGLRLVQSSNASPEERLNMFIENHLKVVLDNPDVTNIYSNEWKHLDASLDRFVALRKQYQKESEELMQDIYNEMGRPLESAQFVTRFLLHTLNNSYFWFKDGDKSIDDKIKGIKNKVLYGLIGKA